MDFWYNYTRPKVVVKKDFREILKVLAVGLAVMLPLPLAYRVWLHYHPQPVASRPSLSEFLARSAEERAIRLVRTPLSKWTGSDVQSEPKIHAWLEAHEKMILPWEWTDGAQRKDPAGYRKLWFALIKEQKDSLVHRMQDVQKKLKAIEHQLWMTETVHAHRTNQIVRIQACAATNSFPLTVKVEGLSKGLLWGWNTKIEEVRFDQREDLEDGGNGWLAAERKAAAAESAVIAENSSRREILKKRLDVAGELLSRTVALEGLEELTEGICLPELCRFVKTEWNEGKSKESTP